MKIEKPWCSLAAIILVQTFLLLASPALADTYKVFTLDSDEARFVYGIDPSGDVVLSVNATPDECTSPLAQQCHFETFIGGVYAFSTNTPPTTFTIDNGTPCSPAVPAGISVLHAVCNNGREVFSAIAAGQTSADLYTGPSHRPVPRPERRQLPLSRLRRRHPLERPAKRTLVSKPSISPSQVPEPASLFLLGTGALATLETTRRRARRRQL